MNQSDKPLYYGWIYTWANSRWSCSLKLPKPSEDMMCVRVWRKRNNGKPRQQPGDFDHATIGLGFAESFHQKEHINNFHD